MSENLFGNRLKQLRFEKDMTGEELGKVFNVTKVAISNWESGRRFPDQDTLIHICDYFNVSIDYLLGRTDNKSPISDIDTKKIEELTNNNEDMHNLIRKLYELDPKTQNKIKKMIDAFIDDDM
ncbi:helix-turn-helix domain-containing protein [Clostridioides mangenotii]|uniref:helix-turn-helix domain-containing protein n=1 Tax=Metaclostridioides mangenotii TaxID=1540 RepID=UPI001C0F4221|nr:helix-turn-helix transcriptional regulator [Clostridioides mangenotii]MBU5308036.1 helix-turn-helix domain-containing protein [Clostridioides mangenotii]